MSDELDRDDEELVASLRALPPEGGEPDWKKLEAAIRAEVAPLSMPQPWWRSWRWLVPIGALAATAACVLVLGVRHSPRPDSALTAVRDAGAVRMGHELAHDEPASATDEVARAPTVWLDGEAVELDDASAELLDDSDAVDLDDGDTDSIEAMLPITDHGWIDALDDEAAARVEQALARKGS